jgi:tetratricopeptide (TPR) repeat protein
VQVGVQVIADRYAYVPLIGIFVAVVWEASAVADRLRFGPAPRAVAGSLVLAALAFATWRQIGYWQSTLDVWTHALQVTEGNTMAESFLANTLFESGRYAEGMTHLRNYARLEPLDPGAHARVAADFQDHGQLPEAIKEYESAIRASSVLDSYGLPGMNREMLAVTYANLGLTYGELGDDSKARDNTRKALDTDEPAVGQMANGLAQFLNAHPSGRGYLRLGLLLTQIGRRPEAQQAFVRAQRLDPRLVLPPWVETGQQ